MNPIRSLAPLVLALTFAARAVAAQELPPVAAPADVLVLGTYHFANPGLDVVRNEVADVLAPEQQREIEQVVAALARFRPTIVAVEQLPEQAPVLDSLYAAYRAGAHALSRNEVQQLGFRLAERAGLARVHPIDHGGEFPFGELMQYAAAHDSVAAAWIGAVMASVQAEMTRRQRELTLPAMLRLDNDPTLIAHGHSIYVRMNEIGAGDGYAGANVVSAWYDRNARIYANVQRLAAPGERVLVIIGAGHLAILRELIEHDPEMRLVEANDYVSDS